MRKQQQQEPIEIVRGEVAEVRVFKDGWGKMRLEGVVEPVMGNVLGFGMGDQVEARGRWSDDAKYGRQFKAQTIRCTIPTSSRGAVVWLASRLPGLGKKRAEELVERFGVPALYEVIAKTPEQLCVVKGITPELARKIQDEHSRVHGESEEMSQLLGWGLTDGQIRRAREVWGKDVIAVLREDPYRLGEEVHGFGFQRSDLIARKMGLPVDHPRRVEACIVHLLREAEGMGHCYVTRGGLLRAANDDLVGVRGDQIVRGLAAVIEAARVIDDDGRVYLPDTHTAEREVAAMVLRLRKAAA